MLENLYRGKGSVTRFDRLRGKAKYRSISACLEKKKGGVTNRDNLEKHSSRDKG